MKDSSLRTRFAAANNNAKTFKKTVIAYIKKHLDLDNVTPLQKQTVSEYFEITPQCVNNYIKEIEQERAIALKLAENYPLSIKALSVQVQQAIGISYHTATNLGLNVDAYEGKNAFPANYKMRLDFKIYSKERNTLTLYLCDIERGSRYKVTLFEKDGQFTAYTGGINFADGFLNGRLFDMRLGVNKKGYINLYEAQLI